MDGNSPLQSVPFETAEPAKPKRTFQLWLDFAYFEQVLPFFVIWLSLLIVLPFLCALATDPKISTTRQVIPLQLSSPDISLNIDLSFNHLFRFKKFLHVEAAFLRESTAAAADFSFLLDSRLVFLDRLHAVGTSPVQIRSQSHFPADSIESEPIHICFTPINTSFNVLDVRAELTCASPVTGLAVAWTTADPRTYTCLTAVFAGLFALAGFCYQSYCVTFVYFLHPENIVSMLVFGASGAAVNPLLYLLNIDIQFTQFFFPLFLAAVKFHFVFACAQLRGSLPGVGSALFLLLCTACDAWATVQAENRALSGSAISWAEYGRMALHLVFAAFAGVCHSRAVAGDDDAHVLRCRVLLVMIGFAVIPLFVSDMGLPLLNIAQDTIYGDVLKAVAAYGYFIAFSLFFRRNVGPVRFSTITGMLLVQDQAGLGDTSLLPQPAGGQGEG